MTYEDVLDMYVSKAPKDPNLFIRDLKIGMDFSLSLQSTYGDVRVTYTARSMTIWLYAVKKAISFCFPSEWWDRINVILLNTSKHPNGPWIFSENTKEFVSLEDEVPENLMLALNNPFKKKTKE